MIIIIFNDLCVKVKRNRVVIIDMKTLNVKSKAKIYEIIS